MSSVNYVCIVGYIATIVLHGGNIISNSGIKFDRYGEDVRRFGSVQYRYFTCWTFFLQLLHAAVSLVCEAVIGFNSHTKNYRLPKHLRGFRDTLFSAIVFPSTFFVFTVFWTLFLYDRSLVLPEYTDAVITRTSNHIMHTLIVPLSLWEVVFRQRSTPRSHSKNIKHLLFHFVLYISVLIYTYLELDFWMYPIFGLFSGTVYIYLLFILLLIIGIMAYYLQWVITDAVWGSKKKLEKN